MDTPAQQAIPSKCKQCNRPMSTPVACDFCHAVDPSAAMMNHFMLLGLPARFELDQADLHRRYISLSRHAHPDFHAGAGPEVRQLHLRVSASLNDAYQTLKDPAGRGDYLLQLLGGKSSSEDKSVPDGFLGTMMLLQEEIADARAGDDTECLSRLAGVLRTQQDGLIRRLGELFAEYDEGVVCNAVRTGLLGEIRGQLNAVSYVRKLLSQVT